MKMGSKARKQPAREPRELTLLKKSETTYPGSPDEATLEAFENAHRKRDYWITFDCPEFTTLCPVTGQPDFGHITIRYVPDRWCLESKSLKIYMFSFRNHGTFHEAAVNRILDDLVATVKPRQAVVHGEFRPRGGIAITVEARFPG
jgi:7-cyano-7-deazaguanine reductase